MKKKLYVFFSTLVGNALLAFAVCAFVVPHNFMLGGTNGIALALHQGFPVLPLWALNGALNLVLFLMGLIFMGKDFAANSLLSTLIYPAIMAIFEYLPVSSLFAGEDPLLCALYCSLLAGLGIGIVIRAGGSTGGMDIPPCILQKYKGIPVGTGVMMFDIVIVLAQVCINGLDGLLLSVLIIGLISVTINQTLVTGEKKVQVIVISPEFQKIRQEILTVHDSGTTMLQIETGFEERPQKAILSVVYAKKYPAIRDAILQIDPNAFIVTSEVKRVNGRGYTLSRQIQK